MGPKPAETHAAAGGGDIDMTGTGEEKTAVHPAVPLKNAFSPFGEV